MKGVGNKLGLDKSLMKKTFHLLLSTTHMAGHPIEGSRPFIDSQFYPLAIFLLVISPFR